MRTPAVPPASDALRTAAVAVDFTVDEREAARGVCQELAVSTAERLRVGAACVALGAVAPDALEPGAGPGEARLRAGYAALRPRVDDALATGLASFVPAPPAADPSGADAALALVPLVGAEGRAFGCLVVADPGRRAWSDADRLALESMARAAAAEIGRREESAARARAEARLRLLERALHAVDLGITITDQRGRIVFTNPAEARMHGYEVEELYGREARSLAPPELWSPAADLPPQRPRRWRRERINVRRDGTRFPVRLWSDAILDDGDRPVGLVTYCEDLTPRDAVGGAEEPSTDAADAAERDALTGLLDRAAFLRRLRRSCEVRTRPEGEPFTLLFVDLDRFKGVNDRHGHAAGDALLAAVGERLVGCVRPTDVVGRIGGDEFALLLHGTRAERDVVPVVQRIQRSLAAPVRTGGVELRLSASVGIAADLLGDTPEELLASADRAMYRAKMLGPGQYDTSTAGVQSHESAVDALEDDLRRAVRHDELAVHFQPIVSLAGERPSGFEALVRWEHPERGLLGPQAFLPVAERTELIVEIDRWVLRAVVRQVREWTERHPALPPVPVSVNVSGRHVVRPDLVEHIAEVLGEFGVHPGRLMVEVTETAMVEDGEMAAAALARLRESGVRLCLDDFGTGYSSLAYLRKFPFDVLKIDRSFVQRIGQPGSDRAIVRSVVALAHTLGLSVTAEGVETRVQQSVLRRLRCEHAQGYVFARPMPAAEAEAWWLSRAGDAAG